MPPGNKQRCNPVRLRACCSLSPWIADALYLFSLVQDPFFWAALQISSDVKQKSRGLISIAFSLCLDSGEFAYDFTSMLPLNNSLKWIWMCYTANEYQYFSLSKNSLINHIMVLHMIFRSEISPTRRPSLLSVDRHALPSENVNARLVVM